MKLTAAASGVFAAVLLAGVAFAATPPAKLEIVEGNGLSPIRVVIYEDLQCPDCANLRRMLDEKLLPRYGSKVAFVHRDFPLARHSWARSAALAGRWVYEQDHELGILFRQQILSEQDHIDAANLKAWLLEFAARTNLDQKGILDSLTDSRLARLIEQDFQGGIARGISKVPTVYVNNVPFIEIIIFEDLARAIDQALSK